MFIVNEDPAGDGYTAKVYWPDGNRSLFTEGVTREELIANVREAVEVAFDEDEPRPKFIHLHYVRDETIAL